MRIDMHFIQNHSPANLNRDDIGSPKTCYFGGVLRLRISSQCIKRSIRTSEQFKHLCKGVRTRQLARLIADRIDGSATLRKRAVQILAKLGIACDDDGRSDMLVYTTHEAIDRIAAELKAATTDSDALVARCRTLIESLVHVPDMALSGRMLETGEMANTTVEAALQVAHAISTHEAHPEVDYYVAKDDIPGTDAGAGYVDEALFASACFYKYFSIDWEQLKRNLKDNAPLAAHTVGAFLRAAALTTPTGKQNSFAAHNPPDGILIDFRDVPISYANAFADPVTPDRGRNIIAQSIAQLAQYANDLDVAYGRPHKRLWFSPNLRYPLVVQRDGSETPLADENIPTLDKLVSAFVGVIGFDWNDVQKALPQLTEVQP